MHLINTLLATLFLSLPVAQAQTPFPAPLSLLNVTYGGSGCPSNSIASTFDSQLPSLQFQISRSDAQIGPNILAYQNRKNCQIIAQILVPANYALTISKRWISGQVNLSEGVFADFWSTTYLSGETSQYGFQERMTGPLNAPFNKTEYAEYETPWTSCAGGNIGFNFNTYVKLSAKEKTPSNATGAIVPVHVQNYLFSWYKCKT